ncbi:MAG: tRNA/rRNA methyltransferase [Bacteroidales bacterium]
MQRLAHIDFVLVRPGEPGNIGAAARALKTTGYRNLILINPVEYKTGPARWIAHGAEDILDNAKVFDSLQEAVAGASVVIGTTARKRNTRSEYLAPDRLKKVLLENETASGKIALVFGSEESGLSNDEIEQCDLLSYLPLAVDQPSLNLSQAVMLYAWLLSPFKQNRFMDDEEYEEADSRLFKGMKEDLSVLFETTGLHRTPALYSRIMERVSLLSAGDIRLVRSVLNRLLPVISNRRDE